MNNFSQNVFLLESMYNFFQKFEEIYFILKPVFSY